MPTLVGTPTGTSAAWGFGQTVAYPTGLSADDVVILMVFAESTVADWTCPGLTVIGAANGGSSFRVTVMVGTGFSGTGTFAPTSATIGTGVWTSLSVTAWADADPDVIIGAFYNTAPGAGPEGPFNVPSVTTTTDAATLLAVGHAMFSSQTFDPAMTLVTGGHDARQAHRTVATAGATGPTTITPSNISQMEAWVHVALDAAPVAPPPVSLREGIRLGDTVADSIHLGSTAMTAVYQGATKLWRPTDSFRTVTAEGPRGPWDGNPGNVHIQAWTPPLKQGVAIIADQDIFVHGVRWWRPGTVDGVDPGGDLFVRFGPPNPGAFPDVFATHSGEYTDTWDSSYAQWVTVLLDEPALMLEGTEMVVFVNVPNGAEITVARQVDYFDDNGYDSRLGLFHSVAAPTGRFRLGYSPEPDNVVPGNTADVWYWVDPIIEAAT